MGSENEGGSLSVVGGKLVLEVLSPSAKEASKELHKLRPKVRHAVA